jgi:ferritin-like metal-binding protein YciE
MRTLTDQFLNSLAEIYYAENQLLRTLPKLARADTDAELREALESLLEETESYVKKVERAFAEFGQKARAKKRDAVADLLEQSNKMVSQSQGLPPIDAPLIAVEQKGKYHEAANCGSLHESAVPLAQTTAAEFFREMRDEKNKLDTPSRKWGATAAMRQPTNIATKVMGVWQRNRSSMELASDRPATQRPAGSGGLDIPCGGRAANQYLQRSPGNSFPALRNAMRRDKTNSYKGTRKKLSNKEP